MLTMSSKAPRNQEEQHKAYVKSISTEKKHFHSIHMCAQTQDNILFANLTIYIVNVGSVCKHKLVWCNYFVHGHGVIRFSSLTASKETAYQHMAVYI